MAGLLPVAGLLAAIVALSFLSGGYIFVRTATVAFVVLACAVVWIWLLPRRTSVSWPVVVSLAALISFTVWVGASVAWSVGPDLSWLAFDVALLYLVVAMIASVTPAGPGQLRLAGYGLVVAMVPAAVYALLGKVLPDVVTHAHLYARLMQPLGYWNVLAVVLVMASLPALEGAARRGLPAAARGAFAAALALFLVTAFFAFSRGGTAMLIVALGLYFVLTNERLQSVLSLVLSGGPVAAAIYHARGLETLFNATTDDALRTAQGHSFGRTVLVALAAAALLQVVAALITRRVPLRGAARRVVGALVLAAVLAAVVAGGLAFASRYGGVHRVITKAADQIRASDSGGTGTNGAQRLLSIGNNGRVPMVREAWRGFRTHPLMGSGAGTFRFTNYLYRTSRSMIVKHAHNQWANVASELGLVGLALFVVAVGGLLVAALRPGGRGARDADRGLLAALQAAAVAFVVHLTVDWDWDMAAATIAFLLVAGVAAAYVRGQRERAGVAAPSPAETLVIRTPADPAGVGLVDDGAAGAGKADGDAVTKATAADAEADGEAAAGDPDPRSRTPRRAESPVVRRRPLALTIGPAARVLITGALALAVASWLVPFLAARAYDDALLLASRNKTSPAIVAARRAHRLDPLAVDPLFTLALLQQQQGKGRQALAALEQARRLQPYNFESYYELGLMQLNVLGRRRAAAQSFLRALALNPYDANARYELLAARSPAGSP